MSLPPVPIPSWTCVFALLFGAAIGSFLNVVIYRMPRGLSLSNPKRSFCPTCKHSLDIPDLFPLFSWLLSKGKCRYCGQPVAARYFWVELINGSLWALIWWQYMVMHFDPARAGFYAATVSVLVAIIFIDWELYIIPDELNAALLVFGIGYHWADKSLATALKGALLGWLMLWGIALIGRLLFRKDSMGHGDIKMMRGVGALIGPALLVANMGIAVISGLVIGLLMIGINSKKPKPEEEEPGGEEMAPETIGSLLLHGGWYLACLDIVAIPFPSMYKWIGEEVPEKSVEDDDWKPSATTIPFGPYLAIGAIICMVFAGPIHQGLADYWQRTTHPVASAPAIVQTFAVTGLNRINWSAECLNAGQACCYTAFGRTDWNSQTRTSVRGGNDWQIA